MGSSKVITTGSIAGIIVGLLVMKGYIAPQEADIATQNLDVFFGAVITIISIVSFFMHHMRKTPQLPASPIKPIEYTVTTSTAPAESTVTIPAPVATTP